MDNVERETQNRMKFRTPEPVQTGDLLHRSDVLTALDEIIGGITRPATPTAYNIISRIKELPARPITEPEPVKLDEYALQWNVVENLKWLAQASGRPDRVPCGELTGVFLNQVADMFQRNVDKIRELRNAEGDGTSFESLTEPPETPDYRFGRLVKGETYAYARGLLVAPTHLPKALDAMEKDGWSLVGIFGETDAENVGFIFKRVTDGVLGRNKS